MLGRGQHHLAEEIRADLMPQPTGAAVDADDDITLGEAERLCSIRRADLYDVLHFQIVVPRAKCAHLRTLAPLGVFGYIFGSGIGYATSFLDAGQIFRPSVAGLDSPAGPTDQHGVHLTFIQPNRASAADAGRYRLEQIVGQLDSRRLDVR